MGALKTIVDSGRALYVGISNYPADSRAAHDPRYLKPDMITEEKIARVVKLNALAAGRGESLAQMALQWVLRDERVTSALIGASRPEQIRENIKALQFPAFSAE